MSKLEDNDLPPYDMLVETLLKNKDDIKKELTADDCNLIHLAMGICGEAGELLDAVKKHVIYRKPLDRDNIIEELGDLEFYMEGLRQHIGVSLFLTRVNNIRKLCKRYENGYSNKAALKRKDKNDNVKKRL